MKKFDTKLYATAMAPTNRTAGPQTAMTWGKGFSHNEKYPCTCLIFFCQYEENAREPNGPAHSDSSLIKTFTIRLTVAPSR